ncbi:nucleoid-associated protein [Clostridium perfringens]|uniref:nucleoid-associated protein n=1 Tax=Clostridium perfringens TaxID=1502 RepID=UPI0028FF8F3D|nr:nucleoid-associated protein [Clostridium perfringens]MDU3019720.1 nucleoid-associated protein [Clostridium perfringens]
MITNKKGITISRVILHVLTKDKDEIFSNNLLPTDDIYFMDFLIRHIKSAIGRTSRRSAVYNDVKEHTIKNNLENLFSSNNTNFIEASKEIAQRLNGIIKIKNQGPYYFLLCNYSNADEENYVAMIILDFSKSFFPNCNDDKVLVKHITSLSENNSKFKKCAILQPLDHDSEYDLIINEPKDTEFFRSNFLQSNIFYDNKKAAEDFVMETVAWLQDKLYSMDKIEDSSYNENIVEQLNELQNTCYSQIVNSDSINIDNFIDGNFIGDLENLKDDYKIHLESSGLIDNEILIDEDVKNTLKVNKVKLDNGIQLIIPLNLVNNTDSYNMNLDSDLLANINISGKIVSQTIKQK